MKCRNKVLCICAWLCICLLAGWVSANWVGKPILLTDEEVRYYTDTAEKLWNEGLKSIEPNSEIKFEIHHEEGKVKILPNDPNKQSVTVDFSKPESSHTVNKPITSFWGCYVFYGAFFGTLISFVVLSVVLSIKETRKSKDY